MKVVFIQDLAGVAKRDEVREVSNGFALNYLFPEGLAVKATPERLSALAQKAVSVKQMEVKKQSQAQSWLGQLRGKSVVVEMRTTPQGTLYAGISQSVIAQAINEQLKIPIKTEQVILPSHLKSVGEYKVNIRLNDGLNVDIKFIIKSTSDAKD